MRHPTNIRSQELSNKPTLPKAVSSYGIIAALRPTSNASMQRRALLFGKYILTASAGHFGHLFTIHDSCNDFPFAFWHIWFPILLSRHRSRPTSRVDVLRHMVGTYLVAFLVSTQYTP